MPKRSSSNRLRSHRNQGPGVFFITKCLDPRRPALYVRECQIIVSAFQFDVAKSIIEVGAFSILPDHWHLLFALKGPALSKWMHHLMSIVGSRTGATLRMRGTSWQDGFHDVEIRSKEQFDFVVDYIHANPVQRKLVSKAEDWEFSSAHTKHRKWVRLVWEF